MTIAKLIEEIYSAFRKTHDFRDNHERNGGNFECDICGDDKWGGYCDDCCKISSHFGDVAEDKIPQLHAAFEEFKGWLDQCVDAADTYIVCSSQHKEAKASQDTLKRIKEKLGIETEGGEG